MTSPVSQDYGRRLIPQILDQLAHDEPEKIVYSIAVSSEATHEFLRISALTLAKAVDKTAWWIKSQIGESDDIQAAGYIGPHDLRHVILTYACVKANCSALFLSPKNNVEGALAVLKATDCNLWIQPSELKFSPLIEDVLNQRPMQVLELPSLAEMLNVADVEPYPFGKTFNQAVNEPFCILHTSGTTGNPKPIIWSHGLIGTMDAVRLLPPIEGDGGLLPWTAIWEKNDTIYSAFPMSHGAGIIMDILMPSLYDLHCVLGPVNVLPNLNLVDSLIQHGHIDIWSLMPSIVDELGETPDVLRKFKSSKFICASGGPVSPVIASKVNDVIRVLNLTGTTEGLFIGNLIVEREDWFWFAFHPWSGFDFREIEPDTYEHWVHRNEHHELFQGLFYTFPKEESVNLKDLYIQHPTKPNLWAFKGRSDDVVVLSNGYKISPLDTEAYVTTHPAVSGCLVVGTGKPQAGLLIELKETTVKIEQLFESIWSQVQNADELVQHKSRISRDYITFAEPAMPFIRTDKGTIKRRATLTLYADYIDRFYSSRGEVETNDVKIDTASYDTTVQSVRQYLSTMVPSILEASEDTDIFSLGLDSLNVFKAINNIKVATGLQKKLAPRHFYANPTLAKFCALLMKLLKHTSSSVKAQDVDDKESRLRHLINQRNKRMSFKLNPFDQVIKNYYMGLNFYFPLAEGVSFERAFQKLQAGLKRTFELIPALDGRMMHSSPDELGYKKGDCRVDIPALSDNHDPPRQLTFKDLSMKYPSFDKLKEGDFVTSLIRDEVLLPENTFPDFPADILVAQANFVEGGCILAVNLHHSCMDGFGVMIAVKAWGESCKFVDGDTTATCNWLDAESFNHNLPEILYELEGYAKPVHEVDPGTWAFLPYLPPATKRDSVVHTIEDLEQVDDYNKMVKRLPPRPPIPEKLIWPPPEHPALSLNLTMFLITAKKLEELRRDAQADDGSAASISDLVQAFFWRIAIRARYQAAKNKGMMFAEDEQSILELTYDGRPYFSSLLPPTYMGSILIFNRPHMSVEKLLSPETSFAQIASTLREAGARVTPSLVHDCYTLLKSLPDYDRYTFADMGLDDHMHVVISNIMLFQLDEIDFGSGLFANDGHPESMRPQIERGNKRFRFTVIYPQRKDGGIELVLGTLPEELELLKNDAEFMQYARLLDC